MAIVHDDEVLGGEPRIEGTRIGVRHVAAHVVEGDRSAAHVADQLDLSLADVHEALSYYYGHPEEMRELDREAEAAFDRIREISLKPPERVK